MASQETKSLLTRLSISYAALAALAILLLGFVLLMALAILKKAPWGDVFGHLAAVLIATGIIGVIYEISLRRMFFKEISEELQSQLDPLAKLLTTNLSGTGVNVHPSLVHQNLPHLFDRASSCIRVLQTWMGNYIEIESAVKAAALRDCKIEILLLDPKSMQAEARSRDLGEPTEYVRLQIHGNIERLVNLCKKYPGLADKIKLTLYDATPIMTLYWYDETCFVGLYWREGNAIAKPQLEIDMRYSYFASDIEAHFKSLWEDERSRPVNLSRKFEG
jgi:hypothetical protein